MEIIRCDMPSRDFQVVLAGDLHYGNINCNRDLVGELIEDIGSGGKYLLNLGDNIEAILPGDKRYLHASVDVQNGLMTPAAQGDAIVKDFMPVRDRILAWGDGNHEAKLWNTYSPGQEMAKDLKCPYGGYNYIAQFFHEGELMFKFSISHGSGKLPAGAKDPIQRKANRKAWLKRRLERTGFTDCILQAMGHTHARIVVEPTIGDETVLVTTGDKIKQDRRHETDQASEYISPERRWYVNTGSFLRLYSEPGSLVFGYAEIAGYEPTDLGWIEVTVQNGRVVDVEERG